MTEIGTPARQRPASDRRRVLGTGRPVVAVLAVAVLAFLAGVGGLSLQGKLGSVQKNDNAAYLPASAESTKVSNESAKFLTVENIPGFVVFHRASGLTQADRSIIASAYTAIRALPGVDVPAMTPPKFAADESAASIYAPLIAKQNGKALNGQVLSANEKRIIDTADKLAITGLQILPAGPGGLLSALIDAFSGLDGALLIAAFLIVILILLVVYRSPFIWIFPLISAGLALGLSSMVIYLLADHNVITLTGQSQGILSVLVLGAGTDYALLLISRYREELHEYSHRFDAMITAWRRSAPAIFASAATVIIGLLCLSFSELNSNRGLGPVAAIGIACTLVVMMTVLPVALALLPRGVFWPRTPKVDHAVDLATHGLWGRIAGTVGRRYRSAWIGTTVLLLVCLGGLPLLKTSGLSAEQNFTNTPAAVTGQRLYDAKFDPGAGAPAVITTNATQVDQVIAAAAKVSGVATLPGSVCVQIDYAKLEKLAAGSAGQPGAASGRSTEVAGQPGCPPAALQVAPIAGRTVVNATMASAYDSQNAYSTIKRLRTVLHAIPGADAQVGGTSAANLDVSIASVHDRNLIIPIVLLVIFIVLAVLLRALVAPLLLILTVVLSFSATLGVCGFAFHHLLNFPSADQSFPLYAFVFLVALGIDYNIFLMTRVREETREFGTRQGILRGLAVTGGVITSAGVVLAATFAVLGVLPLVFLAEIGFAVAFGVLLDTIVVRTILVPALCTEIGRKVWWPSSLATAKE